MARKTSKRVQVVDDDYENDEIEAAEIEEDTGEEAFDRVLSEFSGDGTDAEVLIFRQENGRASGKFLFAMPPSEFNIIKICENLRDEYGGGSFRATLKRAGRVVKSTPLEVEAPKSITIGAKHKKDEDGDRFIVMMNAQMEATRLQMEQSREEARNAQKQMHELMLAMVNSKNNAPPPSSTRELVEVLALLKNQGGDSDGVDTFLKGLEFGKQVGETIGAGAGGENPLIAAIKTVAPVIEKGMAQEAMKARAVQRPPQQRALPTDQKPHKNQQDENGLLIILAKAADKNADPGLYVDLLEDLLGFDAIYTIASDDGQFGLFCSALPGELTLARRVWLDSLRKEVLTLGEPEDDHAPDVSDIDPTESTEDAS